MGLVANKPTESEAEDIKRLLPLCRPGEILGNIRGLWMFLPAGEDVTDALLKGGYERLETTCVMNYVRKDDVVIDVGANVGYYTMMLSSLVGEKGQVYSFEASPATYNRLRRNIAINKAENVDCKNLVISDRNGFSDFYNTGGSSQNRTWLGNRRAEGYKVLKGSIDNLIPADKRIALMKVDVEGSEVVVLRGAEKTIKRQPNFVLMIEYCPSNLKGAGYTSEEFVYWLNEYGFRVYIFSHVGLSARIKPEVLVTSIKSDEDQLLNLWCIR